VLAMLLVELPEWMSVEFLLVFRFLRRCRCWSAESFWTTMTIDELRDCGRWTILTKCVGA
jgi:hypothetical protein